jgi:hypothetical protein
MLIGYAVIAVPTGIITAELTASQQGLHQRERLDSRNCGSTLPKPGHAP